MSRLVFTLLLLVGRGLGLVSAKVYDPLNDEDPSFITAEIEIPFGGGDN